MADRMSEEEKRVLSEVDKKLREADVIEKEYRRCMLAVQRSQRDFLDGLRANVLKDEEIEELRQKAASTYEVMLDICVKRTKFTNDAVVGIDEYLRNALGINPNKSGG